MTDNACLWCGRPGNDVRVRLSVIDGDEQLRPLPALTVKSTVLCDECQLFLQVGPKWAQVRGQRPFDLLQTLTFAADRAREQIVREVGRVGGSGGAA